MYISLPVRERERVRHSDGMEQINDDAKKKRIFRKENYIRKYCRLFSIHYYFGISSSFLVLFPKRKNKLNCKSWKTFACRISVWCCYCFQFRIYFFVLFFRFDSDCCFLGAWFLKKNGMKLHGNSRMNSSNNNNHNNKNPCILRTKFSFFLVFSLFWQMFSLAHGERIEEKREERKKATFEQR